MKKATLVATLLSHGLDTYDAYLSEPLKYLSGPHSMSNFFTQVKIEHHDNNRTIIKDMLGQVWEDVRVDPETFFKNCGYSVKKVYQQGKYVHTEDPTEPEKYLKALALAKEKHK